MISEKKIKELLDEWDKSLTTDISDSIEKAGKPHNFDQLTMIREERNRAWYARDIVRHIRAKIFELEDW